MQIPIRWNDNTAELKKSLAAGLDQIEATRAAAEKMARSLGGDNIVAAAHKTAAAIELIGGAGKLTAASQERVNAVMTKAVAVLDAAGKGGSAVAQQFQALADQTKAAVPPTEALGAALAKTLGGGKLITSANEYVAAVQRLGGVQKLTAAEQVVVNGVLGQAIAKYKALGVAAPKAMQDLAAATRTASESTRGWLPSLQELGSSWVARIASGMLLRDAILAIGAAVKRVAEALPELALRGAGIADVDENFKHLTAQAGLLSDTLLGALQEGTHRTVDNFQLMKLVNQDLAAGLVLTDQQFGTLAKGAFALAQATGGDVKTALDTMNDAMLTGRTRALALLTGKIDLSKAEADYARSLGATVDQLSDEGKLEAARAAILKAVGDATARLGEQTDGLDEKVAQLRKAWADFTDDLGKTIAKSDVLAAGLDGVKDALIEAFGANRQAVIAGIATKIDEVAIELIGLGKVGVEAAGFLVKEFYAVKKIFGDLAQIIDGNRLAIDYFSKAVNIAASKLQFGDMAKASAAEAARLDEEIGKLLVTMKQRGDALQDDSKRQADVDYVTAKFNNTLSVLQARMSEAAQKAKDFVGPIQESSVAQRDAAAEARRLADSLQQSKKALAEQESALKQFAKSLRDATSFAQPFWNVLDTIDGTVVEGAKALLNHGAKLEDVARIYGLTAGQVSAVVQAMKLEQVMVDALGSSYAQLTARLADVEKKRREAANAGFSKNLDAEAKALKSFAEQRDKLNLNSYQLAVQLIQREAAEARAALDSRSANYAQALDAIQQDTDEKMAGAARDWNTHLREMEAGTGSFAKTAIGWLQKIPDTLQKAFTGGGGLSGALQATFSGIGGDIGTDVFGKLAGKLSNTFSKLFGVGITEKLGSILPAIGGVLGSLAGPLIQKIVGFFHKSESEKLMYDVGRDWGVNISKGLADKIAADSKKIGRQAAEILHIADIFGEAGGINPANFDAAAAKLRDVFSMIETGQLTVAQGGKVIDSVWSDMLAAGTDQFGFISAKLKEIIALNGRFGTQSKEIAAFLKAQGEAGVTASNAIIASLTPQISKWQEIKKRIDDAQKAMKESFAKGDWSANAKAIAEWKKAVGELNGEISRNSAELENMGVIALATFSAAVAGGASFSEALAAAGPGLQQLTSAFDSLGISTNNAALKALMLQSSILDKNPTLIQGIAGLGQAFAALSNMGLLNVETFNAMSETGAAMYARLQGEVAAMGGTTKDALLPMQAYLRAAQKAAEELGIPLDENTAELIRQSKELGIWKDQGKTAAEKVTDAMDSLVKKVEKLINVLLGIPDVEYTVTERRRTENEGGDTGGDSGGGDNGGGGENRAATGGRVTKTGIEPLQADRGTDTVPAWLTPGEVVLNKPQQDHARATVAKALASPPDSTGSTDRAYPALATVGTAIPRLWPALEPPVTRPFANLQPMGQHALPTSMIPSGFDMPSLSLAPSAAAMPLAPRAPSVTSSESSTGQSQDDMMSGDVVLMVDGAAIGRIARADILKGGTAYGEFKKMVRGVVREGAAQ